jgi:hypothetical protein
MKYNHKYQSCTRTYSTLRIFPKNAHPDVITNLLKIKPTRISIAGPTGPIGRIVVSGWFLTTQGKLKSKDSRRHIDWLLDKIEPVSEQILALQKQGMSMDISSFWGSASGNGGPTISPEQMTRLVKMNLEVWWDVYFDGEDDEDSTEDNARNKLKTKRRRVFFHHVGLQIRKGASLMNSMDALHQRLLLAASFLDTAAGEIRDIHLSPVTENIHHIGKALAEIYDLLRSIYAVRPDLVPEQLEERKGDSEANRRLTPILSEVYQLVQAGNVGQAIEMLEQYCATEPSELHKNIALEEIDHLSAKGEAE